MNKSRQRNKTADDCQTAETISDCPHIPFHPRNSVTELKGRSPEHPLSRHREAPFPRMQQMAPAWARHLAGLGENSRFSRGTVAKLRKLVLSFVFYIRLETSRLTVPLLRPSSKVGKDYLGNLHYNFFHGRSQKGASTPKSPSTDEKHLDPLLPKKN